MCRVAVLCTSLFNYMRLFANGPQRAETRRRLTVDSWGFLDKYSVFCGFSFLQCVSIGMNSLKDSCERAYE